MPIRLRRARPSDVRAVSALNAACFADNVTYRTMFPEALRTKPGRGDLVDWGLSRTEAGLRDPATHHIVAVDKDAGGREVVVGAAEWRAPAGRDGVAVKTPGEKAREAEERMESLPGCIDRDGVVQSRMQIDDLLETAEPAFGRRDRDRMWTLNSLAVTPDYRRRGIGKMLVRWGLGQADGNAEDVWLISAPPGRSLYLSLGFDEVADGTRFGEPQYVMLKLFKPGQ